MGWSYGFWKGSFYPQHLSSKDFLSYYATQLSTVEVDSTFYRIPRQQTIIEWKQQTPKSFMFSLKFPQKITHIKMLKDCEEETRVFLERVSLLEEKLGVLLLQFPPMFRQQHFPLLAAYLQTLPKGFRYAVEVRNKSLLNEELFALLKENNVALAWVDAAKMPLVTEKTAEFFYVRWEGDRKAVTGTLGKTEVERTTQIREWAGRFKPFLSSETEGFGYFSKYYSGNPTSDVVELLRNLKT
jgi:uncharacterized protein YecE (DUF72 family)